MIEGFVQLESQRNGSSEVGMMVCVNDPGFRRLRLEDYWGPGEFKGCPRPCSETLCEN